MTLKLAISVLLGCVLVFPSRTFASDSSHDFEVEFRKTYEHQLFSLKNPDSAATIKFDSSGSQTSKALPGPWSTCGLLQVERVSLSSRQIEIFGRRVLLALRASDADTTASAPMADAQVTPVLIDRRVHLVMELSSPPNNIAELNSALSHVFEGGELMDRVAQYWKPKTTDVETFRQNTPYAVLAELEGGRPVYLVHPDVMQPPKPIHTPDPTYTDSARQKRLTGNATLLAVINEQGFPEILEVVKGLGEGLDTQALIAVADWRFKPAVKDGHPVAVMINVAVSFKLY
jgi:TonB family protein